MHHCKAKKMGLKILSLKNCKQSTAKKSSKKIIQNLTIIAYHQSFSTNQICNVSSDVL